MIDSKMYVGIRDVGIADMAPSKKDVVIFKKMGVFPWWTLVVIESLSRLRKVWIFSKSHLVNV